MTTHRTTLARPGILGLCSLLIACQAATAGTIRTVALSGQPAPGSGGLTFSSVRRPSAPPAIGDGAVAFVASTTSSDQGVWINQSGPLSAVAFPGDAAPGIAGAKFGALNYVSVNRNDQVAFYADISGGPTGVISGLFSNAGGTLTKVAARKDPAPGTATTFSSFNEPVITRAGNVVFEGSVSSPYAKGIWAEGFGPGLALLVLQNTAAPGTGGTFSLLGYDVAAANNIVSFNATLSVPGVGSSVYSVWKYTPAGLQPAAIRGQEAPGANGNTFNTFSPAVVNDSGHLAFEASLAAGTPSQPHDGIYKDTGSGLTAVASTIDDAPGLQAGKFYIFNSPAMNSSGRVAFSASISGLGYGVWSEGRSGVLELVAGPGMEAPGTGGATFRNADTVVLTDQGLAVFHATLQGAPATADTGLWAQNTAGQLVPVVLEGEQIEVLPGDFRAVSYIYFGEDIGYSDGRYLSANDHGDVVFCVSFTDGSTGIFTSAVPEPATLGLLAVLAVVGAGIRRRRRRTTTPASLPRR